MAHPRKRVLFYVQHLLGVGHVKRASLVAAAMAEAGMDVHIVLGGTPVAGIGFDGCTCHQLPEARATDALFSGLVDGDGSPVDESWRNLRRGKLLSLYNNLNPDVLVIELFPFGRRQFRFELLPLLDAARTGSATQHIVCSVRDILVTKNDPEKLRQTVEYVNTYFDSIIVHGDPDFIGFDATFPHAHKFAGKIQYSGYVAPPETSPITEAGQNEVIVAAGGGAVGGDLMICAANARTKSPLSHLTWRFLMGPNLPKSARDVVLQIRDPQIIVEPNRPDYNTLLQNCTLSISQGGYNTLMDIVRARCPAVIVPFGKGTEDEQNRRTKMLNDQNYVTMLKETELSPDAMVSSIEHAMSQTLPNQIPFSLDGAKKTAELVLKSTK